MSMYPTLKNGQIILALAVREFREGQVVVAFQNGREVIKRIESIEDGKIFLLGDNTNASTDSRHNGSITDDKIEGIVFWPLQLHRREHPKK